MSDRSEDPSKVRKLVSLHGAQKIGTGSGETRRRDVAPAAYRALERILAEAAKSPELPSEAIADIVHGEMYHQVPRAPARKPAGRR